ncbi:MAG: hypothetical protein MI700_01655 [Balneolales bacterium]|nr:hypothetical protein [Balneolales bacterium]
MKLWFKDALLDIAILILFIVFAFTQNEVLTYIVWGYTILLFAGKVLYFFVPFLKQKTSKTTVPNWFYHSIYLGFIIFLLIGKNYYLGSVWLAIWILSTIPTLKRDDS